MDPLRAGGQGSGTVPGQRRLPGELLVKGNGMATQMLLETKHSARNGVDAGQAELATDTDLVGIGTVAAFMDWWWLAEPTTESGS